MYKKELWEIYQEKLTKKEFCDGLNVAEGNNVMALLESFEIALFEFRNEDEYIEKIIDITNNIITKEIQNHRGE